MTLRIAIIADDLTGALDTSTSFALRGLRVAVPTTLESLDDALASDPEVIAVNTESRALATEAAASRIAEAGRRLLRAARPAIIFKKIDSRLKGNIGAESASLARAFGFREAVVAPAVPDQERFTIDGAITGRGMDASLPIASFFDGLPFETTVRDARTDSDLDSIVAAYAGRWDRTLAIGARGLGGALARAIGGDVPKRNARPAMAAAATLFAFGSTDPITLAQIKALPASVRIREAPGGEVPPPETLRLPLVLQIIGEEAGPARVVAARFAEGVADCVAACGPANLVMGGGDTTLAILQRLGVRVLYPVGEAAPGLPEFDIVQSDGRLLRCVAKSGGFGTPDVLAGLLRRDTVDPGHAGTERLNPSRLA
jgi:D-threonate/D-erythronate kinase